MHYGIYVPNFGDYGDARRLAGLAHEAEEAGWDGFFIWDHVARAFEQMRARVQDGPPTIRG